MPDLTIEILKHEAGVFADTESDHDDPSLHGVTDGKAIGTYFEHKFQQYLRSKYNYEEGSSAKGIDFPEIRVDMKVTSVRQPQSSCPFKSARQKIYGLGYSLVVFAYDKSDDDEHLTGCLDIRHVVYIDGGRTADFQMTTGLNKILENDGNKDDIIAFLNDKMLPVDEIEASNIADEILDSRPRIGYLTISNALQWRLQYRRVIDKADSVPGVTRIK